MMKEYSMDLTEGTYSFTVNPDNPDTVFVTASDRLLEILISSLELAGVEDGRFFEDYEVQDSRLEISKADLCLFFQFEVLNYLS